MNSSRLKILIMIMVSAVAVFSLGYIVSNVRNTLNENKIINDSGTIQYRTLSHLDLLGYADKILVCQTKNHIATIRIEGQKYDKFPFISINGSSFVKGHMVGQNWYDKAEFTFYVDSFYDSGLLTDKYSVRFEMSDTSPSENRCYLEIRSLHGDVDFVHEYGKIILQDKPIELPPLSGSQKK